MGGITNRLLFVLIAVPVFLSGCASTGSGWYDDWGKCSVAGAIVGGGTGAVENTEAAAGAAVAGALIGGVVCAMIDKDEEPEIIGLDSDGDGVLDRFDQCPGTAPGVAVDSTGCPIPEITVLQGVHFHHDSAALTADSSETLDRVAATLRMHPELMVEVAGHTDSHGTDDYNQQLSQRRADAVRTYLISKGAKADRLSARGYGESQPVADNGTPEGRSRNRRVELQLIK